ncbi:MAG TPA: hypothetical protein VGR35_23400 [Tepidisphaeraceae bacterium]|nr:hypothetical protein [Tepidisphaeraceae bacterium]
MCHIVEHLEPRRLFAAGDVDPSFGTDGIADLPAFVGESVSAHRSFTVLPDDRILVLGGPVDGHQLSITRLTATGAVDTTFGAGGHVGFSLNSNTFGQSGEAIFVQADGKIVVRADANVAPFETNRYFVRFNPDGTLDETFGAKGFRIVADPDVHSRNVTVQPDAKIIIAAPNGVHRLAADGSPDPTFGTNGFAQISPAAGLRPFLELHVPLVQSDGKIVVVGNLATNGNPQLDTLGIVRLNASGTPDATFGNGVIREITPPSGSNRPEPVKIVEAAGGKLVIAMRESRGNPRLVALRVNADGSPDSTFDGDGFVSYAAHVPTDTNHLSIDDDGRILLAGPAIFPVPEGGFMAVRLLGDGSLDPSFGHVIGGLGLTPLRVSTIAVQSDGILLQAGQISTSDPDAQPHMLKLAVAGATPSPIGLTGGTLSVAGTGGADVIIVAGAQNSPSDPNLLAVARNRIGRAFEAGDVARVSVTSGAGDDYVEMRATDVPGALEGATGNDRLAGGAGNDSITGDDGYDSIDGGAGNDTLIGNDGRDWIRGQDGSDSLFGNAWGDFLDGGAGNDIVNGGGYPDRLTGGPGNDTLRGGLGNDLFFTNDGTSDHLFGDAGLDSADPDEDDVLTSIETT